MLPRGMFTVFGIRVGKDKPALSNAATNFILGLRKPDAVEYLGDGLIPWKKQEFPPSLLIDGGNVSKFEDHQNDVLHTEEPSRTADIQSQLLNIMPLWFTNP